MVAAAAAVAAAEERLKAERGQWQAAESSLQAQNAAEVARLTAALESTTQELTTAKAEASTAAATAGTAAESLRGAQADLETETAARKAAQARADDAGAKLAAAEAKLEAALNAARTQSRYLIKLNRELKVIRATFDEISAAVALHGAVDMSGLLKVVSTSTMPPEEVRKAMAAVEGDASTRLAGLMDERKRLQNEIQVRSDIVWSAGVGSTVV